MGDKINYFDWVEIENIIHQLATEIKKTYNPDILISAVRGGMIPSVILSHILNVRDIQNVNIKETISDDINAKKNTPVLDNNLNLNNITGKKVLIVDDILGSGATIRTLKDEIKKWNPKEIKTAVCIINEENWEKSNTVTYENLVEYNGKCVRGWVIFPWEN